MVQKNNEKISMLRKMTKVRIWRKCDTGGGGGGEQTYLYSWSPNYKRVVNLQVSSDCGGWREVYWEKWNEFIVKIIKTDNVDRFLIIFTENVVGPYWVF